MHRSSKWRSFVGAQGLTALLALTACTSEGQKGDPGEVGPAGPAGPAGPQGPAGPAGGPAGPKGDTGAEGLSTLVATTAELPGANCAMGGVKLEVGLDADRNGTLDPAEAVVALTRYVCNGQQGVRGDTGATGSQGSQGVPGPQGQQGTQGPQGPDGQATLVKTSTEAAGANCATGGVKFEAGSDANRNGMLEAGEVNASLTRYVCNGAQGPQGIQGVQGTQGAKGDTGATGTQGIQGIQGAQGNQGLDGVPTVALTTNEAAGANCATGGVRLQLGADANRNGVLDAGEVNASLTRYVCNGAQGIQGIQGAQGNQGPQGLDGVPTVALTTNEAAGANCATGGVRLQLGADANRNGVLDAGEVNASLTRYMCNGAQGPQGIQGPQGPSGAVAAYGDGSAGALSVLVGNTLDLSDTAVVNAQPYKTNTQFTIINIAGTLIVPSGTVLRATGGVTVTGTITVNVGTADTGGGPAVQGVSRGVPGLIHGGMGLPLLAAARLTDPGFEGGGSGDRSINGTGGEGGGSLVIAAQGNVSIPVGGIISANGNSGTNVGSTGDVGGPGGGGGGIIVIAAKGNLTVGGSIRANGGAGGPGRDFNAGTNGAGGGGGGGGGIINLISTNPISVTGTVQANGGSAGTDVAGSATTTAGSGGGACGGDGGDGGGIAIVGNPFTPAQAGSAGHIIQRTVPSPENLL
jgi:hypothetical protein